MSSKWFLKKGSEEENSIDSAEKEVAEQPAEEAPAEEAPAEAVEEAPAEEAPAEAVEEAPAEEAPAEAVEEAPTEEAPTEEAPAPKKPWFRFGKGRSKVAEEEPQSAEETPAEDEAEAPAEAEAETPAQSAEQPAEEAPAETAEEVPSEQPAEEVPAESQSLRPSRGKLRAWLQKMDAPAEEEPPKPVEEAPQPVEEAPQPVEEEPQPPKKRPRPAKEQPVKERPRRAVEYSEPEEHRGQSLKSELTAVFVEFVRHGPRIAASVGGFLLVVVLLLSLNSKVKEGLELLQQPQQPADPVTGEAVQQQDSAPEAQSQVSAPTQPVMAPLAQQDIRIELGIEDTENGPAVRTSVDMGGFYDVAVAHVSYDENNNFSGARIDLREAENCITLTAENALRDYSHCEGVIQIDIAVDESVLAAMGAEEKPQYEWFYRTDEEDEWEPLDAKLFMISDDTAKVTYPAENLAKKLDSDEVAQFRLVYRRYNVKGGSLTVDITGITVADKMIEEKLAEDAEDG